MKRLLQFLVKAYQKTLSPFLGNQCRFTPSCSCYMHDALERHGAARGVLLGAVRILKCNPFYKGAWVDEVPDTFPVSFTWGSLIRYKAPSQENDTNQT